MKTDHALSALKLFILRRDGVSTEYVAVCDKLSLDDALSLRETLRGAFADRNVEMQNFGLIDNAEPRETRIGFEFSSSFYFLVEKAAKEIHSMARQVRTMSSTEILTKDNDAPRGGSRVPGVIRS